MNPANLKPHRFAEAMPKMLPDEYAELVADIKAHGLNEPLVLYEGKILDGVHRHRACIEFDIPLKTKEFNGTAEAAKAFVQSLNVHRRHLTTAQKNKIISSELKRDPAQSDRAIAKKAGRDHKTVAKARSAAVGRGEIPRVAARKDSVGRSQPAQKRPKMLAVVDGECHRVDQPPLKIDSEPTPPLESWTGGFVCPKSGNLRADAEEIARQLYKVLESPELRGLVCNELRHLWLKAAIR